MKYFAYLSALTLLLTLANGCSAPEFEGTAWKCAAAGDDCGEGWVCNTFTNTCEPENATSSEMENGVSGDKIVLGMSAPITTGTASDLGQGMKDGIETYFSKINAEGGVYGRQLELLALDDGYQPEPALENMRTLIEGENRQVFAVIGNVGTPTAAVTVPYANEQKVIFFGAYTGAGLLRVTPNPDRYIFNFRASYKQETEKLVSFYLNHREPSIRPEHIGVLAQGTDSSGTKDGYGQAGFDGVAAVLKAQANIESKDIPYMTYKRGTDDIKPAVGYFLRNFGDLGCQMNSADCSEEVKPDCATTFNAAMILIPTYSAAASFIIEMNTQIGYAKTGTDIAAEHNLNEDQLFGITCIDQILFSSVSFVGAESLKRDLNKASTYQTTEGGSSIDKRHCEKVMVSQVVPHYTSQSTGVIAYREDLETYDPNLQPGFISLEGYLAAHLFVEGLKKHGYDNLTTEPFVDTLTTLSADLGIGAPMGFTPGDHQASESVWGTILTLPTGDECDYEAIDLK